MLNKNYALSAALLGAALSMQPILAAESENLTGTALSLYMNTQLAFSEAALCRSGSLVVARVAEDRGKGLSREQVTASFGENPPPALLEMIGVGYSYEKPGPGNANQYYQSCAEAATAKIKAGIKKQVFSDAK